tara:strand:+ start:185 stop:397 length:213 start_codon:yes stop_codon:yes gene_type:complete
VLNTNRVYKHHSGKKYILLGISNLEATKESYKKDAFYIDEDNVLWSRPVEEFEKGFELTEEKPWIVLKTD